MGIRSFSKFKNPAIFETPPGWKESDVTNRGEAFCILATEIPSFRTVPPARHRTSDGIKFSPFSALRAEGVQSPSIGSSPSIERRGTSPRSVVVASCFSVSDPTKTKSTPIVFFVYRTLSIHFRTDRAFSIPTPRAHQPQKEPSPCPPSPLWGKGQPTGGTLSRPLPIRGEGKIKWNTPH